MSEIIIKEIDKQRRKLLLGALAASATGLLSACGGGSGDGSVSSNAAQTDSASRVLATTSTGSATPLRPIPSYSVSLDSYGGVPGASPAPIINAFNSAYSAVNANGGGTLLIPPGTYNLGNASAGAVMIRASSLNNVLISGYGATLPMTTTDVSMPVFLYFSNSANINIAGLHFTDPGASLGINRKGAICIEFNTTVPTDGAKVVDCSCDSVVTFVKSYGNGGTQNFTLTGLDISGPVNNSNYGINVKYNVAHSKCNLTSNGVRRAFICYGVQYWDIWVNANTSNSAGSNALIELPTSASALTVTNLNIYLTATGSLSNHVGLITFFQQDAVSTPAVIQNVNADVRIVNATSLPGAGIFSFLYWDGASLQPTTIKTWSNLQLTGGFDAASAALFAGANKVVNAGAPSTSSGNAVAVSTAFQNYQNLSLLPAYFSWFTPATTTTTSPTTTTTSPTTTTTTTSPTTSTSSTTTTTTTTTSPTTTGSGTSSAVSAAAPSCPRRAPAPPAA